MVKQLEKILISTLVTSVLFIWLGLNGAFGANILIQRGLDQALFRGMDILGAKIRQHGHNVEVSSPFVAAMDNRNYDVLIGNSQGAIRSLIRKQAKKPKLIIAIDPIGSWPKPNGVKTYVLYGLAGLPVKGAINIPTHEGHLAMSFSKTTHAKVLQILINEGISNVW